MKLTMELNISMLFSHLSRRRAVHRPAAQKDLSVGAVQTPGSTAADRSRITTFPDAGAAAARSEMLYCVIITAKRAMS